MHLAARALPSPSRPSRGGRPAARAAVLLAAVTALLIPAAGFAAAAPTGPAVAPIVPTGPTGETRTAAPRATTPGGQHCTLGAGDRRSLRCFVSFPAAVAFATGGAVTDAPGSPGAAAADPAFTAKVDAITSGSTLVGIEWADLNWKGSSLTMYAAGPCDNSADVDYRFASMPSGWNDRISSFKSYSNCAQQLFRGTNFSGGALTGIIAAMSYVGSGANDQASSITFN